MPLLFFKLTTLVLTLSFILDCFHSSAAEKFAAFWQRILGLHALLKSPREHAIYVQFLINTFQSLSDELIRGACIRVVSLPLWHCLSAPKLQSELERAPKMQRLWKALQKKDQTQQAQANQERDFLPSLLRQFFKTLRTVSTTGPGTLLRQAF